jgi:hypothetical protein
MAEIYRVAVQRVVRTLNENGAETDRDYVSVIEFEAPADALLRFAAAEVAAALGAPGVAVTVMPERVAETPPVTLAAEPAQAPAETESSRPTRTRRTKAQKAADDAAQAEGYRDAAHKAEVLAMAEADRAKDGDGPTGDGDADLAAAIEATRQSIPADVQAGLAPGAPVVIDGNALNGVPVMPTPEPVPAGSDSAPPAAPWNPFNPS